MHNAIDVLLIAAVLFLLYRQLITARKPITVLKTRRSDGQELEALLYEVVCTTFNECMENLLAMRLYITSPGMAPIGLGGYDYELLIAIDTDHSWSRGMSRKSVVGGWQQFVKVTVQKEGFIEIRDGNGRLLNRHPFSQLSASLLCLKGYVFESATTRMREPA